MEPNARAAIQCKIGDGDVDGLSDAGSCVVECRQQSLVALSGPRGRIWSADYRLDFFAQQESNQRLAMTLHRDGERALDGSDRWRVLKSGEAQKGADRGQTGVPAANRVLPNPFEMIQERQHEGSIQIGEGDAVCRFVPVLPGELEQQPETIAIGCHGLWTGVPLADQTVEKELLDQIGKAALR